MVLEVSPRPELHQSTPTEVSTLSGAGPGLKITRDFHFEGRHFHSLRLKTASNSVQLLYKPLVDPGEDAQPHQELTQGSWCQPKNTENISVLGKYS